jgi:hypothetical protein
VVLPPGSIEPNQTAVLRIRAQADLARPDWTVASRRLAVIS